MKKIRRLQTQGEGPRMLALEPQMNLTHGLTPKRLRGILELADQGDILEQHLLFADMEDRCEHLAAEMGKRKRALLTLTGRSCRAAPTMRGPPGLRRRFGNSLMPSTVLRTC